MNKFQQNWAGKDLLSRDAKGGCFAIVNILIQTKPLYKVMKHQARRVIIKTATQNGVDWRQNYRNLENSEVKELMTKIHNPNLTYPSYYHVPFHGYEKGNLCWKAAFEAESATQAMALRIWPKENLTWSEAQQRLRGSFHQILGEYGPSKVEDILDIGCSVGISTFALYHYYKQKHNPVRIVGLDLSPYMLAVAKMRDEENEIAEWVHGKGEETDFPDNSFDLVTLQFLLHELPRKASKAIFQEAHRLLRPGGCIAIVDNNPLSPVIQNLPPALFVLMKSTEPWSDDYYTFDVKAALQEVGFEWKITTASDPRHRTIIGVRGS